VVRTAAAPLYLLAGLVRERGMKVVLTGEGADEMLGGYDIFKEAKLRRFWARQPASTLRPLLLRRLYPYMANLQAQPEAYRRAFFHVGEGELASPFFSHLPRWRLTQQIKGLLSDEVGAQIEKVDPSDALREELPQQFARWDPFAQAQYLEATILLPGYILSSQGDRVAMGRSVEGRYPFLDVRVMEWAGRLDARHKMKVLDEKHLLKRAARGLVPSTVLERKKQPYRAPDAASFFDAATGAARHAWVEELLSDQAVRDAGLWRPQAVQKLTEKAKKGALQSVKDNMALVTMLSSQILHHRFIRAGDLL
jgi:asparagine synthase (glutamine-hydrolysing)